MDPYSYDFKSLTSRMQAELDRRVFEDMSRSAPFWVGSDAPVFSTTAAAPSTNVPVSLDRVLGVMLEFQRKFSPWTIPVRADVSPAVMSCLRRWKMNGPLGQPQGSGILDDLGFLSVV